MDKSTRNRLQENQDSNPDFWFSKRYYVWFLGFTLRILVAPLYLDSYDYTKFRVPIVIALSQGKGLYSDFHYNQMPIYPYLSACMYIIIGEQNPIITAIALKFPQIVADALIPVLIYKIGIILRRSREGLHFSFIYAINPVSLTEIFVASFHSIASLFMMLAIYCLLNNHSFRAGILIALGFFTSEYPIIALCISILYLWKKRLKILKFFLGFFITSILILVFVLIPNNTTIYVMIESLKSHPVYHGTNRGLIQDVFRFINSFTLISSSTWFIIWALIFGFLLFTPFILYMKHPNVVKVIDVLTIQITLISIFFISNHTKHIFWLLPWVMIWGLNQNNLSKNAPFFVMYGYFVRGLSIEFIPELLWFANVSLILIGILIIRQAIRNLVNRNYPELDKLANE